MSELLRGDLTIRAPYPVVARVAARDHGPSDELNLSLPSGRHTILLRAPDVFLSRQVEVSIDPGQPAVVEVPRVRRVRVRAVPANCVVSVDGTEVGESPFWLTLVEGEHRFRFHWPALGRTLEIVETVSDEEQQVIALASQATP